MALRFQNVILQVGRSFLESGEAVKSRANEAEIEDLLKSSFPADTMLIFTAPGVDKRKKLYKAVEKHGRVVKCSIRHEKFGVGLERGTAIGGASISAAHANIIVNSEDATAKEIPQEAKMPKEWKNAASAIGRGSLNKPKIITLIRAKPARRSATKTLSTRDDTVKRTVKMTKAAR